jgi:hypothetical protein
MSWSLRKHMAGFDLLWHERRRSCDLHGGYSRRAAMTALSGHNFALKELVMA